MDEHETTTTTPSYRLRPITVLIAVLSAFGSWLDDITELLCAHHNWTVDREAVAREMRADLERIVGE